MPRPAQIRRVGARRSSKSSVIVMASGLVLLFGAAWLGVRQHDAAKKTGEQTASAPESGTTESVASAPGPSGPARLIDGVISSSPEVASESPYLAVIIDNHSEARPASGLNSASVVYEAPVEAGITRLLAIYPSGAGVGQIGPVRSVRPYYVDWSAEYGALLAHVGGSPEALARIKAGNDPVTDLNEFWNGANFWRASSRSAPHNTYTSIALLEKAAARKDAEAKKLASWRFKDDVPAAERPAEAALKISSKATGYGVTWRYVPEKNAYERLQGGVLQRDGGEAVVSRNIVVQLTTVKVIDDVGRRRIQTTGEGQAVIALDGQTYRGTWRKASAAARTRFYDASGTELRLNRGTTWIEVVPDNTDVQ